MTPPKETNNALITKLKETEIYEQRSMSEK